MRNKTARTNGSSQPSEGRQAPTTRGARAAARVAERFAHAPSYSEALAGEARAAVRAAKAASKAAQEAQAAVQYVLEGLEAASLAEPDTEPVWNLQDELAQASVRLTGPVLAPAPNDAANSLNFNETLSKEAQRFSSRRGAELLEQPATPETVDQHFAVHEEARAQEWTEPVSPDPGGLDGGLIERAQPIYANLIEFPREMVATRKVRPRLAEGPLAVIEEEPQLSIFEVDPGAISIEPAAAAAETPTEPEWMRAIEPEPQTLKEPARRAVPTAAVELAPVSRRLLAVVVDCTLVAATFLAAALLAAEHASQLPGPRTVEVGAAIALLAIGAAYQTLFFTLARSTPGMRYAGIGLCTLEGFIPSRAQRYKRLIALPLSVLPIGLGLAWALFDDSRLTWHDRLSETYLRKRT